MQNRINPFHRNLFGEGGIFAQKCLNPFIRLFFHCKYRQLHFLIQFFQKFSAGICNLINLCTAHIKIPVFFRKLTEDQVQNDHNRNHHRRQSYTVCPLSHFRRMKYSPIYLLSFFHGLLLLTPTSLLNCLYGQENKDCNH